MGNIKNLPTLERPREKALRYGLDSLSDVELLTLLISTGYKEVSALEIAANLLTNNNGLLSLSKVPLTELKKNKGIKNSKALKLAAIFELHYRLSRKEEETNETVINTDYLYNKYKEKLLSNNQENLVLIMLDSRKKIIHEKTMYVGTDNKIIFSYKDIWRELLNYNARSFYLIHNHPTGKKEPSKNDIFFTSELFRESKRINIPMIDHIIVGKDGYHSFTDVKKLKTLLS